MRVNGLLQWWWRNFDPCNWWFYRWLRRWSVPDLASWLTQHPNVAAAILWQNQPASMTNAYAPPTSADKTAWTNWTAAQKADLDDAYRDAYVWLECGAAQVAMDPNGLTDQPINVQPGVANDTGTVLQRVTPGYMWRLYVAHVAFTLAAESRNQFPWSIAGYGANALRYLLDSTTMAWNLFGTGYWMGTYAVYVPANRADNLPQTAFAPPTWTYPWLKQIGLVGTTSRDTILRVLQWMRQNMWHFYGSGDYGTFDAVWQYRGYPPLSKIVNGTVDANNPGQGLQHWTAGCHGSVGFLCAVLRAVNIPVQPVWICGHELPHFITDNLYLSHGDDPYNLNVRNSPSPIDSVLVDEATYKLWFTTNLSVNITNSMDPGCANVGRRAAEFV